MTGSVLLASVALALVAVALVATRREPVRLAFVVGPTALSLGCSLLALWLALR